MEACDYREAMDIERVLMVSCVVLGQHVAATWESLGLGGMSNVCFTSIHNTPTVFRMTRFLATFRQNVVTQLHFTFDRY